MKIYWNWQRFIRFYTRLKQYKRYVWIFKKLWLKILVVVFFVFFVFFVFLILLFTFYTYEKMNKFTQQLVKEKWNDLYNKYKFFWYKLDIFEYLYKMSIEDEKNEVLKKIKKWCRKKRNELSGKVELTAFVMCLNHKIWKWYEKNEDIARMYNDLWMDFDCKIEKRLKWDDLKYYFHTTD